MCSVVGIVSEKENKKIAYDIYDALLSLQHRGQDAAGIATLDLNEKIHFKKVEGLALNFSKKDIADLNGNIGLGHTRYSTAGSAKLENAHPYLINYPVSIAVACNGDTQNYEEIKKFLKEKGVFLQTDCDIEAIAKLFAYAYSKSKDVFQSASFVMKKIIGAYSIICIIQNKGLLAFRDPYGIRPMVMGKKSSPHDSYIFASESVALDCLDYKRVCNVKPGEAIFIDRDLQCTRKMICNQDKKAHCMFEWVYLARPDSIIEDISVYGARENLGKKLAQIVKQKNIVDENSIVVPVPDSGRTAAITFAEELNIKYRDYIIKNRYIARTFIMHTDEMRNKNIKLKLNVTSDVKDKTIFLVDDSIVRGNTARKITKMLRKKGAKKIIFVSACPKIISTCKYGINISTKEELIAHEKTIEEIKKDISVDELIYPSIDDLKESLGIDKLCTGCLTGKYPYV